ncbi:MAG: D-alanine--D-alanine ligase [Verrucomicrobia bacterium]|nr:D-alanine--D-alanine ligase [Verrucomicrobiota bacterium]
MNRRRVVVMAGGPSAEREVSLRSGEAVARALSRIGHRVESLDPRPGAWSLPAGTEMVFLALHGTYGEDGTLQAELDRLGVRYTGCDAEASRLAFDKVQTKRRCREAGVPVARDVVIGKSEAPWPEGWAPPVVIKPARQGSSVGLQFVDRVEEWQEALRKAFEHGDEMLVEERILGIEATVGVLNGRALPVVEVRPKRGAYDYANKYTPGCTEYFCPAPWPKELTERVQREALRAFASVGGRDYGRVDVMVRESGEPVVLEVNTLPGMTETSLLPKAAAAAGLGFDALCQSMLELAWARRERTTDMVSGS